MSPSTHPHPSIIPPTKRNQALIPPPQKPTTHKGWAAMTSLVSLWLQPSQFAMAFGFLSTSSRMGDLASKLVLGTAVADGWGWRSLFAVAAALQLVVALANAALLPKHSSSQQKPPQQQQQGSGNREGVEMSAQQHKRALSLAPPTNATAAGAVPAPGATITTTSPTSSNNTGATSTVTTTTAAAAAAAASVEADESDSENAPPSWAHIRAVVTSRRFAAIAAAVAALHVVMEFDKYIPLYLHKSLHLPPGLAAQGAALYPLSQLLALGAAGLGYDRLTPRGRLLTTGGLCALVVVFYAAQLLLRVHELAVPDAVHLGLIFLSGAAVAVPYYLPASIFLAEVGGKGKCTYVCTCVCTDVCMYALWMRVGLLLLWCLLGVSFAVLRRAKGVRVYTYMHGRWCWFRDLSPPSHHKHTNTHRRDALGPAGRQRRGGRHGLPLPGRTACEPGAVGHAAGPPNARRRRRVGRHGGIPPHERGGRRAPRADEEGPRHHVDGGGPPPPSPSSSSPQPVHREQPRWEWQQPRQLGWGWGGRRGMG
jgi:hypothetical protein